MLTIKHYFEPCSVLLVRTLLGVFVTCIAWPAMATPLLPDLFPWADQARDYMYDGVFDTTSIRNRVLYRFHGALPNIGAGALELREVTHADDSQDVYQRIYQSEGGVMERFVGTYENVDPPYGHLYLVGIAQYNFRAVVGEDGVGPILTSNDKISYALVDSVSYDLSLPNAPLIREYNSTNGEYLGISVGWADVYSRNTRGQWADATGLASGRYWLEVIADPYNQLLESDETNNTTRILLDLTIPPPQILPGDYNDDGEVNAADYTVWRNTLGAAVATPGLGADGDGDGEITGADYPVWKAKFGTTEAGAGASLSVVPEPELTSWLFVVVVWMSGCVHRTWLAPFRRHLVHVEHAVRDPGHIWQPGISFDSTGEGRGRTGFGHRIRLEFALKSFPRSKVRKTLPCSFAHLPAIGGSGGRWLAGLAAGFLDCQ